MEKKTCSLASKLQLGDKVTTAFAAGDNLRLSFVKRNSWIQAAAAAAAVSSRQYIMH